MAKIKDGVFAGKGGRKFGGMAVVAIVEEEEEEEEDEAEFAAGSQYLLTVLTTSWDNA